MIVYIEKGIGLHEHLNSIGLGIINIDGVWQSVNDANHDDINAAITAYTPPVPDLTPRQFNRFLVDADLDLILEQALPSLRSLNKPMYTEVASQLKGGTFYWHLTEQLMMQLMQIIPNPPLLDFEQFRQLWITHSNHHIAI